MRPGVYVTESVLATPIPPEQPTQAAGALVAPLPSGPTSPTLITSWYGFSRIFGPLNRDYEATFAANMFFRSGGRELYVTRVVREDASTAQVDLLANDDTTPWITFSAKSPGTYGNTLRIRVTKNINNLYDIEVLQEAGTLGDVSDDTVLESYTNLDLVTFGNSELVDVINVRSQFINATWGVYDEALALPTTISVMPLVGGGDGGDESDFTYSAALTALGQVDRTLVLFSPGNTTTATLSAMVDFAEANGHFVVIDTPANLTTDLAVDYAESVVAAAGATNHAAIYYPHLWVTDSTSRSRNALRKVAPSGAVVGMMLGIDNSQGVFKAPAGTDAVLPGVVSIERTLTANELEALNNNVTPVNAIRVAAGVGPVVMGARTLNQTQSTRYVNIRRTLLFLTKEMKSKLEFALFRNNEPVLWGQMQTVLDAYLDQFWSAGGLRGNTKEQAFYVKIDRENNTPDDIVNGVVNVEVGVALQYPAEFIKIKLTQTTVA